MHAIAVADSCNFQAALTGPVAEGDDLEHNVEEEEEDSQAPFQLSVSDHDVIVPMPAVMSAMFASGHDRSSCILASCLRPEVVPGQACRCESPREYDADLKSAAWARDGNHDYTVYFDRTKAANVCRWKLNCPNGNPACVLRFNERQHLLWECTDQTMISEQLFYECFNQVSSACCPC